jgi:cytoskeletal protein CcmA (bactofilin family)
MGRLSSLNGTLAISETGVVEADIDVGKAIIEGQLLGDIHATKGVEIGSHARVIGNIQTRSLSIRPGALFEGQCIFLPEAGSDERNRTNLTKPATSAPAPEDGAEEPLVRLAAARQVN